MRRHLARLSVLSLTAGLLVVSGASAVQADDDPGGPSQGAPAERAADRPHSRTALLDRVTSDQADVSQRRLARVAVTQDLRANRVRAVATYAAVPTASTASGVYVWLGRRADGVCQPGILVAGGAGASGADGSFFAPDGTPSTSIGVTRSQSGATVTLVSAASATIGRADWNCAYAASFPASGDTTTPYTALAVTSLEDQFAPVMQIDAGPPLQGNTRGKWTTVSVDVRNHGFGAASGVRVAVGGKGMAIKKKSVRIGNLSRRTTASTQKFRVRLRTTKPQKLTVRVQAAGGYSARQRITIAHRAPARRVGSVVGRYYWGFKPVSSDRAWDNVAVRFVNKRFAHVGFAKRGVPTCRTASKQCVRYTFNKRTGKVRVGKQRGRVTTAGLTLGKQDYSPLTVPRRGSRIAASLKHQNFRGFCGISCVTWTERLVLDKRGRFVRTRLAIGSIGAPGLGTVGAAAPPDQRGRYQVLGKGRIRFTYANGKKRVHTIGIEHDLRGKPNARSAGLLVDDVNFYW